MVFAAALTTQQLLLALFTGAAAGAIIGLIGVFVRISYERTERKRDRLIDAADQLPINDTRFGDLIINLITASLVATEYASALQWDGPSSGQSQVAPSMEDAMREELERLQDVALFLPRLQNATVAIGESLADPLDVSERTVDRASSPDLRALISELGELPSSRQRDQMLQAARDLRQKHDVVRRAIRAGRATDEAFYHFAGQLPRLIILFAPESRGAQSPVVAAAVAARGAGIEALRVASFPRPAGLTQGDVTSAAAAFRSSVDAFANAARAAVRGRRL